VSYEVVIVENELSDLKKANLVCTILNVLIKDQLSINQITEILEIARSEAKKIPIIVSCNQNDLDF